MKKYSYVNKKGEKVEVTKEHLETAVKIKITLQEASPSRRASWKKLVEMMEKEGFHDAENSEPYRCLIKWYQKTIGKLPSREKHENYVAENTLDSIKEIVGELYYEKRENQNVLREINKGKRKLVDFGLILEQVDNSFKNHDFSELKIENNDFEKHDEFLGGSELIVCLSDIHIGAIVDSDENQYNYEKAVQRMSHYISRVVKVAKLNDVDKINVVGLGDMIEHSNMRYGQAFDVEFNFSEQIVKASDLIIKFLYFLVAKGFDVTYSGIGGNHDRITDKDKNLHGDHAVKLINKVVESFFSNVDNDKFTYIEAKDYSHSLEVNGLSVLCLHGDLDSKKDDGIIRKHEILDNKNYDLLLMGHFHSVEIREIADGKYMAVAGSLKGKDDYSNKIRKSSSASQTIVIIDEDGNFNFDIVKLK